MTILKVFSSPINTNGYFRNSNFRKAVLGLSVAALVIGGVSSCAGNKNNLESKDTKELNQYTPPVVPKVPDYILSGREKSLPELTQIVGFDTLVYKSKQDSILFNKKELDAKEEYQKADLSGLENFVKADKDGREAFKQADLEGLLLYKDAKTPEEKYEAKNKWKELKSAGMQKWVDMKTKAKTDWQNLRMDAVKKWDQSRAEAEKEHCSEIRKHRQ